MWPSYSLGVRNRPPFRYLNLIIFDGLTHNLDHPVTVKQADPLHTVHGSFAVVHAKEIDTVLALSWSVICGHGTHLNP
jgi:hypothetical protein